jgi:hypothetical protein
MAFNLPRSLISTALALTGLALPAVADDSIGSTMGAIIPFTAADAMNFGNVSTNQCMQGPKLIGACAGPCIHPAGLIWSYRKPVAVVEVTCKAGQSQLLGGPFLSKLASAALGATVQQDCGSAGFGLDKAGNTKPRYYDVHVFRVTSGAYLSPQGLVAKGLMTAACPSLFKSEDWSTPVSLAGAAVGGSMGLIPVYLSEADPTWKSPIPTPDSAMNTIVASTVGAIGTAAQEGVCAAAGAAATLGLAQPSFTDKCIGAWGLRGPNGGWVSHKNESIAAMITAARAYQRVSLLHLVESEIPSKANIFSFVYPPVHPEQAPGSGLRGSGCYTEGTIDPRWYTQNEVLLPMTDPTAIMNTLVSSKIQGVNKGYFVATYWRDTSCCTTVCGSIPYPPFL